MFPLHDHAPRIALLAAFAALAAYLYTGAPLDGDGAAYTLQGLSGDPLGRPIHAGVLLPLWAWVHLLGPGAANAFALPWAVAGLLGVERLGHALAPEVGPWARLLAPAVLLGAAASWQAALFLEVYGPLSALAVGSVVAMREERPRTAGALLAWMVLCHPGALALMPGLLVLGGGRVRASLVGTATLLLAGAWLALAPAPWSGPRGILALPTFDLSPFQSLQRAWRLLSRDLGVTALPVALGALAAWPHERRALLGVALVALGSALAVDRYADNAGQLPALWLACGLAPLALRWRPPSGRSPALAVGLLALSILGAAEATSRHDLLRRQAERRFEREGARCSEVAEGWADGMIRRLACRPTER